MKINNCNNKYNKTLHNLKAVNLIKQIINIINNLIKYNMFKALKKV